MKRFLLASTAVLALTAGALAQVNTVPQVGVTSGYVPKATYSSAFVGLVPVTAGTDVVCIKGSATKTIKLTQMKISGTAATAVQSIPVVLVKRATADTGGTPASTTANPGVTTQIAKRDSTQATATATLISYTANPTINDAAPVYLDSQSLTMPIVTSVVDARPADFNYTKDAVNLLTQPTLRGVAQQICANIQGVTLNNAAVWNGVITWTEE